MLELARAQANRGHEVCVVSPAGMPENLHLGEVSAKQVPTRARRPLRDYEYIVRSAKHVRAWRPDVVHVHAAADTIALRGLASATYVLSLDYFRFRGSAHPWGHRYWRRCLDAYDLVLPVATFCRDEVMSYYDLPASKLAVLYNGVDLDQFQPDDMAGAAFAARMGWESDEVRVLYLGRVCRQKGSEVLLKAFAEAATRHPRLRLLVAGPIGQFGDQGADPEGFLPRLRAPHIRYLGAVHEDDLRGLMNAAHIFCMPTLQDEMFGMAALEAQASGLPVVASRHGGLPEAVASTGGLFVPPGDASALSDAFVDLAADPTRRDAMGGAGTEHAKAFAWSRLAERSEQLYEAAGRA